MGKYIYVTKFAIGVLYVYHINSQISTSVIRYISNQTMCACIYDSVAVAAGGPNGLWPLSTLQGSTELYIVDNDNDVQRA